VVIGHFGYWPSFHDAEIISMTFVRDKEKGYASADMKILAFEKTDRLKDGSFELTKHCLIDIEFIDLLKNEIEGFNHQNALAELKFGKRGGLLFCELNSARSIGGYIESKNIRINKLTLGISPHL